MGRFTRWTLLALLAMAITSAGCATEETALVSSVAPIEATATSTAPAPSAEAPTTLEEPATATTAVETTVAPPTTIAPSTTAKPTGSFNSCPEGQELNDHDGDGWGACTIPTTTTAPPPPPSFSGTGDTVIELPTTDPYVAEIGYTGARNFVIWELDANLEQLELVTNTIGAYMGRRPINLLGEGATRLQIEAAGDWTITLVPLVDGIRQPAPGPITGTGDDVVFLNDTGVYNIEHIGERNFVIWAYTEDDSDLVANEIGNYTGTQPIRGPAILVIESVGTWTLTAT